MARYWDTSALVHLLVEQNHSRGARDIYRGDPELVVWQFTKTEAVSALTKATRTQQPISIADRDAAISRLDQLARQWTVVELVNAGTIEVVEARARKLLLTYPLKSGDALQLAGALSYFDPRTVALGQGPVRAS